MKRSKLNKVSKQPISKIQKLLWIECRRVANDIYKPRTGPYKCFICEKEISGSNKHLSHLIPKSVCGAFLKYDVYRNLKWCCMFCNVHLGGNLAEYYMKMVKIYGQEYVDQIYKDKQLTTKAYDFYLELLEKYKLL